MTVRIRAAMEQVPAYVAGKKAPGAVILASNESPFGLLPSVAATIDGITSGVSRYPDMSALALVEALAAYHHVEASQVAVGAGSVEVVGQIASAVLEPGDEVVYAWRAFEAYPIITRVAGGTPVQVPLLDHVHDLDAMAKAVTDRTRIVIVCNPNNPTGTAIGSDLVGFVDSIPGDVVVVIDEAYHHYTDAVMIPDAIYVFRNRPNVVVTRTFSKAFALAGLRVGYCIGAPDVIAAVRKTQIPFSVSGLAQQCAIAALGDEAVVSRRAAMTISDRERVTTALHEMKYVVPSSQANFVWLPIGESASGFAEHCAAEDVLVRPFPGDGVRVTIGLPEENDRFLALARSWAASHPS